MTASDNLLEALEFNPQTAALMRYIRPFIPALVRKDDDTVTKTFIELTAKKKWNDVYHLVWPLMTEDERDALSKTVLLDAQNMVDNLKMGEDIIKQVLIKVVQYLIGKSLS